MESKRQWMATNRPKTTKLFRSLFPGNNGLAETIGSHMQEHGYDQSQPIIVWDRSKEEGRNALYVVDGHTRLVAAKQIGLPRVYVARVKFPDEEAALQYAIHNQRDRRNITDADILRCIEAIDKLKSRGGDRKSKKSKASSDAIDSGKSAADTAKIVGTSQSKVEKARSVMKHANEDTKNDVLAGKKSINRAYRESQNQRKGADTCKECGHWRVKLSPRTGEPMSHGLCHDCRSKQNKEEKNRKSKEEFDKIPTSAEAEKFWNEALPKLEEIFENPIIDKVGQETYKRISSITSIIIDCDIEIMRKSRFEES